MHYSTDYVFDGTNDGSYTKDDAPNPINAYRRCKLVGKQAIQSTGADHHTFRATWVYAARGNNFLRSILRLSGEREELSIIDDQVGAPAWARLIADTILQYLCQSLTEKQQRGFKSGMYILTSRGETSWYDFTKAILENAHRFENKKEITRNVKPITTADYPTPAKRPLNSRLATDRLERNVGLSMPSWALALRLCLEEIL